MKSSIFHLAKFIATGGYSGTISRAPGTVGSCTAFIVWLLIGTPVGSTAILVLAGMSAIGLLGTSLYMASFHERSDPQEVVIDEWLGLFTALTIINNQSILLNFIGLVVFRLFDITKPFPVSAAEDLPGARGVVLDDIVAGIIAGILVFWGHILWSIW